MGQLSIEPQVVQSSQWFPSPMSSILTNTASMNAVSSLRSVSAALGQTQTAVSSGKRINDASDNAAYWSIATTMRSDHKTLGAVKDALAFGSALVDSSYNSIIAVGDVVSEIKSRLVAAREPGVDRSKIETELRQLKAQAVSITESSAPFGSSLIFDNEASEFPIVSMVGAFVRGAEGNISVSTLDFDTDQTTVIDNYNAANGFITAPHTVTQPSGTVRDYYLIEGIYNVSGQEITLNNTTSEDDIDGMIQAVDAMMESIIGAASIMGATQRRIDLQADFATKLMDVIDVGVGRLVDADMDEEATRLRAQQAQQQLVMQALSIANSNSDNILSLFR